MKRFYREVAVAAGEGGFAILLDGKAIRTPARNILAAPTRALAEAIAGEWRAQGEHVAPLDMPLTQLLNTALDRVRPRREAIVTEIAAYAATDLICHRAETPPELVERQRRAWDPMLDWLEQRHRVKLVAVCGLSSASQERGALTAIQSRVAGTSDFELAALHLAVGALGSVVLALALAEARIDADTAFAAGQLDELYQMEKWGIDDEAVKRLERIRADISAAAAFVRLATA
jgi:chaperone required for assembly of F1-ATPase